MTHVIHLVEITAVVDDIGTTTVLRCTDGGGYNHPSAPGYYEPRLKEAPAMRRDAWSDGTTGGRSRVGYGILSLINVDGALDGLLAHGFDGQSLRLLVGVDGGAYSSFAVLLTGTVEQPEFTLDEVRFRIRDRQAALSVPVSANAFAGTGGLEGTANDIAGRRKPLCFGAVSRVPSSQVDAALLIHLVHHGLAADIPAVYDNGVVLGRGADYANQGDMLAVAPAAGQYRVWLDASGSYFRLGAAPAGQVTADIHGDATGGYATSAADIANRLALRVLASGDIVAADVTALDAVAGGTIGLYIDGDRTIADCLDEVLGGIGAWWGFDALGRLRMGRLSAPSGAPVVTFRRLGLGVAAGADDGDIVSLDRVATADPGQGVPIWSVTVQYYKNHTVVTGLTSSSASQAERDFLAREFRQVTASDPAVKIKHALAGERTVKTALIQSADAQAEADRLLALFQVPRDMVKMSVVLDPSVAAAIDIGSVVAIDVPRFGWAGGKPFTVVGLGLGMLPGHLDLTVWG